MRPKFLANSSILTKPPWLGSEGARTFLAPQFAGPDRPVPGPEMDVPHGCRKTPKWPFGRAPRPAKAIGPLTVKLPCFGHISRLNLNACNRLNWRAISRA